MMWATENGWRQALASMAPSANIDVTLVALGLPDTFEAIVSAEEVRHGKPDPEVFLLAAERLGIAPERCTVIEDSPQGVEAAKRAGMRCIGVGPLYETLEADVRLRTLVDARPSFLKGCSGGPTRRSICRRPSPRLYSDPTDLDRHPEECSAHFNPILTSCRSAILRIRRRLSYRGS